MIELQNLRKALLDGSHCVPDVGMEAVSIILKISHVEAREWIALYGDPSSDPISGVFLANCVLLDGGVILNTSLNSRELAVRDARRRLATDLLVLLLTTLIVFGSGNPENGPAN